MDIENVRREGRVVYCLFFTYLSLVPVCIILHGSFLFVSVTSYNYCAVLSYLSLLPVYMFCTVRSCIIFLLPVTYPVTRPTLY